MKMRNGIIIIAQAALLQASAPTMASDAGYAILRGVTESIEQYNKAREEEAREQRAMERLQELQRQRFEQARQLQIEQWEREKAERQERLETLRRQAAAQKQQVLEQQKAAQLVEEEQRRRMGLSGSGFLVAPGYVATNAHVVADFPYVTVRTRSGQTYAAMVVAKDSAHDLALLHVAIKQGGLTIRPASSVSKGENVYAIGYPVLQLQGSESKITEGVISSFSGMQNNDQWFQISVPIQHGNSGGPLLNKQGEVVGVVVAAANAVAWLKLGIDIPQNVNYAIKPDLLLAMMKQNGIKPVPALHKQKQPLDHADQNTVLVMAKGEADLQAQPEVQRADGRTPPRIETKQTAVAPKAALPEETKSIEQPDQRMLDMPAGQSYQYALVAINKRDYATALKLLNTAQGQGYVPAATALGTLYDQGHGVAVDQAQALRWFRFAAEKGHPEAQVQLGRYYSLGKGGLSHDPQLGRDWLVKAANQDDTTALFELGMHYLNGDEGYEQSKPVAVSYLKRASLKGHTQATSLLPSLGVF